MKRTPIFILLSAIVILSSLSSIVPVTASDGQFVDHILLFEPPFDTHTFTLTLEKNQKYEITCELFSPGVEMEVILSLSGPDGDGNGFDDEFVLGAGPVDAKVSSVFGCALTGNYTLDIFGNLSENANMHLAIYDRGPSEKGNPLLFDISGYYNTKTREYWVDLEDDTLYTISTGRVNSIPGNETIAEILFGQPPKAFVTVTLYDEENRPFNIIRNVELEHVYGTETASASFGVSFKGEYSITVEVSTESMPTVNIMLIVEEGNPIGDGPEDDPIDPDTNSTTFPQQLTISVPKWTFGVVFAVGMVFVLIAVAISRERSMKNILQ